MVKSRQQGATQPAQSVSGKRSGSSCPIASKANGGLLELAHRTYKRGDLAWQEGAAEPRHRVRLCLRAVGPEHPFERLILEPGAEGRLADAFAPARDLAAVRQPLGAPHIPRHQPAQLPVNAVYRQVHLDV